MAIAELPQLTEDTIKTVGRPLRVCHLSLTLQTGGLERILADLARHHHPDVCELSFIAMRAVGRFADEIRQLGCPVSLLQSTGRWGQVRELARLLRREQIDVLHTHNTYPHLYGSLAARLAGVPVVIQTRHGQRAGHGWKSRTLYRLATHLCDRVVAVSEDARALSVDVDHLPTVKVQRIWNGIDLASFRYREATPTPVAISVARLSAEKDFPTLLKAFALAHPQIPELRLTIVGDGAERQRLEELARELGIAPYVNWAGERTDVPDLLAQAGFFVTSSSTEGISLTLLEAMAVGLPVVATAAGGNSEIVVAGETGLITPVGDIESLAAALVEMYRQRDEWPQMGRAGCDRVHEHFDVQRMVTDYEDLYLSLWNGKQHRNRKPSR